MLEHDKFGFEVVRPIEVHARLIMEWRNDKETLKMSCHTTPKEWSFFWEEFRLEYFSVPELPPLFVTYDGKRVAFLRFRPVEDPLSKGRKACEVSINVSPSFRGKGYGKIALQELKELVRQRGFDDIYAEVKENNEISKKLFLAAGYQDIGQVNKCMEDTGEELTLFRYIDQLTPIHDRGDEVFVIAEVGSNWKMGTPKRDHAMARALIDIAVEAGADAVKFQTYRPETVYVHNAGQSDYLADAGIEEDISTLFAEHSMPYEMIHELADYCRKCGIAFMSTPFSKKDFQVVDPYVERHKIASYEISHVHLIELAASSGKPTFISTGASTEEEVLWAVKTFYEKGGRELTLMQCTAKYPADDDEMNLRAIPWMKSRFQVPVGLSDHSRDPLLAPLAAVALGATVIEKHITLSNHLPGPDHAFAILPGELHQMIQAIRKVTKMKGSGVKTVLPCEKELREFARRGLQALQPIREGDCFKEGGNVAILRPGKRGLGVHPKYLSQLEGRQAKRFIEAGSGIKFGDWN